VIKNSQKRISKRRQVALANRTLNRTQIQGRLGIYSALDEQVLGVKLGRANADIENLTKKGVRL
jgi:hypothetical protein